MTYEGANYLAVAVTLAPRWKQGLTVTFGAKAANCNTTARAILSEQRGPDSYYEKCWDFVAMPTEQTNHR